MDVKSVLVLEKLKSYAMKKTREKRLEKLKALVFEMKEKRQKTPKTNPKS